MDMIKILGVLAACLGFGALLASWGSGLPLRPGVVAAVLLIGSALWMRRHWAKRKQLAGDDPSAAERNLWVYLAGTAIIVGYVLVVLMTPGSEVHRNTGDTGGFDSWLMLGGAAIAWFMLYERGAPRDERDRANAAFGDRVGYWALVSLLMVFLLALGFAPRDLMQRFTHWLIANSLLCLIMLASLVQYVAQLIRYAQERRLDQAGLHG
jgi:hypothetical protein